MAHVHVSVLLILGVLAASNAFQADDLVQGPEPMVKRSTNNGPLSNYYDCPLTWYDTGPSMPSLPCPPGQERPNSRYGAPHPRNTPCPPWVDDSGTCHVANSRMEADRCVSTYGQASYDEWTANRYARQPIGLPGTPAPPCQPGWG